MSAKLLERLKSEEFAVAVGFLSTPRPLRRFLLRSDEVAAIREALKQGAITDNTLRQFVSLLMEDLRRGQRFPHELALAALAVVLEMRPTDFADEFLHDLAGLRLAEMSICIRVARETLKQRVSVARNERKTFRVGPFADEGRISSQKPRWASHTNTAAREMAVYGDDHA